MHNPALCSQKNKIVTKQYSPRTQWLLSEVRESRVALILLTMGYSKPIIVAHSAIQMADCRKGPCGRPSCTSKPSGTH